MLARPGQGGGADEARHDRQERPAERAATPARREEEDQQQAEQREACPERQHDQRAAHHVRIDAGARPGGGRAGERPLGRLPDLLAHVPDARGVERRDVVAGAVIAALIADDREVEDRPRPRPEYVHVGRIGDEAVEIGRERIGDRAAHRRAVERDRAGVWPARLEHDRRPGDAARLDVEHGIDLGRGGIALQEDARAEQPQFLALVDQEDDGAGKRPAAQQVRDLEQGRDADAVVRRAGPGGGAVVMGDQHQRAALRRADARDEVAHARAGDGAAVLEAVAGEIVGDAGGKPHLAHRSDQPRAHRVAFGAVRPMRALRPQHRLQPPDRASGVEIAGDGLRGRRRGRDGPALDRHRAEQKQNYAEQPPGTRHRIPPLFAWGET